MTSTELTAAEAEWLDRWTAGPAEDQGSGLPAGAGAPDLALADHTGRERKLSEFWAGQPLVDDPWRATAEFVISPAGLVRLCYFYQYCEDFPPPRVLTTAARLS